MTYTFDDSLISDLHKDAYGFRPSAAFWHDWNNKTPEQKQMEWEYLCSELEREEERQRKLQEKALDEWSSRMHEYSRRYGITLADAVRWDMEAHDAVGDVGYYCYKLGISYVNEGPIHELLKGK